jgi:hypothetical protein
MAAFRHEQVQNTRTGGGKNAFIDLCHIRQRAEKYPTVKHQFNAPEQNFVGTSLATIESFQ